MKRRLEVVIRETGQKERVFMTNIQISRATKIHTFSNTDRLGKRKLKEIGKNGKRIIKKIKKIDIATPCTISIGPKMILVRANRQLPNWSEIEKKIIHILTDSLSKEVDDVRILREDLSLKSSFKTE